jgi:hypothetical protein
LTRIIPSSLSPVDFPTGKKYLENDFSGLTSNLHTPSDYKDTPKVYFFFSLYPEFKTRSRFLPLPG